MAEVLDDVMSASLESKYNEIMGEPRADVKDEAYAEEKKGDEYLEKLAEKEKDEGRGDEGRGDEGTKDEKEETAEEKGQKELSEPAGVEDETEPVPDNLVRAGRAYGLTDETIIDLSENHPDALEVMARSYEWLQAGSLIGPVPEKAPPKQPEIPKLMDRISVDVSELDTDAGKTIKGMESTVNKLVDANNELKRELFAVRGGLQTTQAAEQARRVSYIDSLFDKVAEFPELGRTAALSTNQKALRGDVYDMAVRWQRRAGGSFEDSLAKAANSFRGLYGRGGAPERKERDVVDKLNRRKTKFTARPTGQKTTQKFANSDEKAMSAMDETGKKLDLW